MLGQEAHHRIIQTAEMVNIIFWGLLIFHTAFIFKIFDGAIDQITPVTRMFPVIVSAKYIRINPTEWQRHIALRFEVLGCDRK